jgi:hypothetical protein
MHKGQRERTFNDNLLIILWGFKTKSFAAGQRLLLLRILGSETENVFQRTYKFRFARSAAEWPLCDMRATCPVTQAYHISNTLHTGLLK